MIPRKRSATARKSIETPIPRSQHPPPHQIVRLLDRRTTNSLSEIRLVWSVCEFQQEMDEALPALPLRVMEGEMDKDGDSTAAGGDANSITQWVPAYLLERTAPSLVEALEAELEEKNK